MKNIVTLTIFELKKYWTIARIIVFGAIFAVISIVSLVPKFINLPLESVELNFGSIIQGSLAFFIPVLVLFFTGAIVAGDVRSFYLRTILARPILKYEYLASKYFFALINLLVGSVFFAIIPAIFMGLFYESPMKFDFFISLLTYILYIAEGSLFISISIWISTLLRGYTNIFILAIWIFLEASLNNGVMNSFVSYNVGLAIFADFFFPGGFSEASKLIESGGILFYESLMWGLAALAFFVALSFYQITKIKIDVNSD